MKEIVLKILSMIVAFFGAIYAMFSEPDGTFSWRKGLTAITALTFAAVSLGYAFTSSVRVLPGEYTAIIAGVFVFYFGKDVLGNVKIGLKEPQ